MQTLPITRLTGTFRRTIVGLACTCFALGVAGCGGSSDGLASAADVTASETTEAPATTATTDTSVATSDDAGATEADDAGSSGGEESDDAGSGGGEDGSCLEGDWMISEEELAAYYAALGAESGVPMEATGTARFQFEDETFVYDATFDLAMDVGGQSATATADGNATGSYTITDGVITTELESNTMNILVNVGGIEMDGSDLGSDFLNSDPINDTTFSCDGPTLYFKTSGEPHPVRLEPYDG